MIIGLTGKNASGKGAVAEFLKNKSFYYYSLSDVLREHIKTQGLDITRENLIRFGNELRATFGSAVLAERVLTKLDPDKNYVIDSFRNPAEVKAFRSRSDFYLVGVEAPELTRFERIAQRARERDPKTLEQFLEVEGRELKNEDPAGQQLSETIAMADFTIVNDGSIEALYEKVTFLLSKFVSSQFVRPGWDDYFMNIARIVASRSNCIKRKVASVIVKDNRIIATGYNGTPRGAKNCYEGGCPRCNSFAEIGTRLEECLCSHGEENAITQAAYWGISVKDATIYTTLAPCLLCTKMIINSGISEVVYNMDYALNEAAFKLFQETGVKVRQHKI